jgi:hypothetical protein
MPTTDPAMTKAEKMNKIGVKRTKCNDYVYKEKLKKKKLEKKLEEEDSDYEPTISLRPKILMMKWMYLTANLFQKLLLFRKTIGSLILAILLLMEWKTSHLPAKVLQSPTSIQMIIAKILFLFLLFHLLQ